MKGLFYVATITVAIVLKSGSCPGVLSITCKIGTYSYNYEKNITCNKIETDSHTGKGSIFINRQMQQSVKINE